MPIFCYASGIAATAFTIGVTDVGKALVQAIALAAADYTCAGIEVALTSAVQARQERWHSAKPSV